VLEACRFFFFSVLHVSREAVPEGVFFQVLVCSIRTVFLSGGDILIAGNCFCRWRAVNMGGGGCIFYG
jgi:hypothetical protein